MIFATCANVPHRPSLTVWTHLVERTPDVNGAVLNDFINHFRDGLGEVRVGKLGLSGDEDDALHCACQNVQDNDG